MRTSKARIEVVFGEAIQLSSPEQRAVHLATRCGGDRDLRREVEELIQAYDQAGAFLTSQADRRAAHSPAEADPPTALVPVHEKPGDRIGRYKLLERIGEGGCGVVYVAEQEEPVRRRVALKVIKLGMDTRSVIARFEAERQALALMEHPNIAKVLDAGATETGRPFFVMELVRGLRITDYCDQQRLSTRERLGLFVPVCRAIQHAHQKGIIHRDIKPSNILVTLHDGVPVPKVIDFGIAKATTQQRLTDKTLYTAFEQFIGTPAYMSPEQAELSGLDIDTRSDIYALGVLLYELLTGQTPFDAKTLLAAGLDGMRRIIREQEPVRPSTRVTRQLAAGDVAVAAEVWGGRRTDLDRPASSRRRLQELVHQLQGDLDWIVMKCLEKDRTRRYETANGLASDLERHLHYEPVMARPPDAAYRLRTFVRRNRLMVTAAAVVVATLGLGAVLSSWQWIRADHERERARLNEQTALQAQAQEITLRQAAEVAQQKAEAEERKARLNAYASDMNLAFQALRENRPGRVRELLERHRPRPGERDLRGWEWGHLWHESESDELWSLDAHDDTVSCLAFSGDGRLLASGGWDRTAKVWDFSSRRLITTLPHATGVQDLVFSPDDKFLVTVAQGSAIAYWDVANWREVLRVPHEAAIKSLAVSPDGRYLTTVSDRGEVDLRDFTTAECVSRLTEGTSLELSAAFSPAEPMIAVPNPGGIALWNLARHELLRTISHTVPGRLGSMMFNAPMVFSPDGTKLAIGGPQPRVLDLSQADAANLLPQDLARMHCLAFSPDGTRFAAGQADRRVTVWDAAQWRMRVAFTGHRSPPTDLAFSPDGALLASSSGDHSIRVWDLSAPPEKRRTTQLPSERVASWSSGDAILLLLEDNWFEIHTGYPATRVVRQRLPAIPLKEVHVSPQGRFLCLADQHERHRIWDVAAARQVSELGPGEISILRHRGFSPDETMLTGFETGTQSRVVWRVRDGQAVARQSRPAGSLDWHWWCADSRTIMIPDAEGAHLWDVTRNAMQGRLTQAGGIRGGILSRDGRLLATLGPRGGVKVWDARTGQELFAIEAGDLINGGDTLYPFDFTPDNRRLAVVAGQACLKIYDLPSGWEVGSPNLDFAPGGCKFSPDGRWLALGHTAGFTYLQATPFPGEKVLNSNR